MHTSLSGEYKIIVSRAGVVVQETEWFDNLVLNSGLDMIGYSQAPVSVCRVGTGTSPVEETDIYLQSPIATYANGGFSSFINDGAPTYAATHTLQYTFTQGSVIGNISEVGVTYSTSLSAPMFSRALITDGLGNPSTITLIAIDQLTVFYKIKTIPSLLETSSTFQISGENFSFKSKLANAAGFGGGTNSMTVLLVPSSIIYYSASAASATLEIGPVTNTSGNAFPAAVNSSSWSQTQSYGSSSRGTYTTGTYYLDSTFYIGIQLGNTVGGIGALYINYGWPYGFSSYQIVLDHAIAKDNTKTLSLVFRTSWSRS